MTSIFFVRTIPHTGTHFINNLLRTDPKINVIGVGDQAGIQNSIEMIVNGKIDIKNFEQSCVNINLARSKLSVEQSPYVYLGLYSHIILNYTRGKFWLEHLIRAGYTYPTVMPLRDPVLTSLSTMLQTGTKDYVTRDKGQRHSHRLFQWLISNPDNLLDSAFFVPMDLWGRLPTEQRVEKIRPLFENFFGLGMSEEAQAFVKEWPIHHPTIESLRGVCFSRVEQNSLLAARDSLLKGQGGRGFHPLLDEVISWYAKMPKLQEFFKQLGYTNLCWFNGGNS